MGILLAITLLFAAETPVQSDSEVWNEGVEAYRAGDVTNAVSRLRSLFYSKTHAARAAEVVAAIEHERGNREEAAVAAQIALRMNPDDARTGRNFTRATDGLAEDREKKRIEGVLKAFAKQDPAQLLKTSTDESRRLMAESGSYATNVASRAVELADAYERRAKKLADAWIPLREIISQSVTNETDAATILGRIEQDERLTLRAAKELGDLESGAAYATLGLVENEFTDFLKRLAPPPLAIREDQAAQTNAYLRTEPINMRSWQGDALDFTRGFRAQFPNWARAYEQQAQADTNMPPFTTEAQAKVSALANELEKLQLSLCEKPDRAGEEKSLKLIDEIIALLPNDGQNQSNQHNQQQNQPQQNPEQNQQDPEQNQQNDENQQQNQDQQDNEQNEEDEKPAEEKDAPSQDEQEVESLIKKVQERQNEYEEKKRRAMRQTKLPPNERDW